MALIDDFKARFTEFDSVAVDALLPILEPVWPCYYGGVYEAGCSQEIILNLLAHLFVLESNTAPGPRRPVASHSAGGVSESFDAPVSSAGYHWRSTKYGQRFVELTSAGYGALLV